PNNGDGVHRQKVSVKASYSSESTINPLPKPLPLRTFAPASSSKRGYSKQFTTTGNMLLPPPATTSSSLPPKTKAAYRKTATFYGNDQQQPIIKKAYGNK